MNTKEQVLQACTVEGNVVKLPAGQLDRKLYQETAKALELIGGKWKGGKVFGFVFQTDPTELLQEIATGEKRNLKKEFQFFATPAGLADKLVELAMVKKEITAKSTYFSEGRQNKILEPSAGQGAIIDAIHRKLGSDATIFVVELMDLNRKMLNEKYGDKILMAGQKDFLVLQNSHIFDWIIANPPFTKNQDIDHVKKMYELLAPDGVMVSIMSPSWTFGSQKKQVEFRNWLDEVGAEVHKVEAGAFKESGTTIESRIVVIKK